MRNMKLAYIINEICKHDNPSKKSLQKIIYFLQEKGLKLGYVYGIHHYGPYCPRLENNIQSLEMDGIVKRERSGSSFVIKPSEFIDLYISETDGLSLEESEKEILEYIVNNIVVKSPLELELLSTVHFVVKNLCNKEGYASLDKTVVIVENIKGDKFDEEQIKATFWDLCNYGLPMNKGI